MAEMVAAITVVCLPALKSLVGAGVEATSKRGATSDSSRNGGGGGYNKYATSSSHFKLSSGRDMYATRTRVGTVGATDSGSETELNVITSPNAIYKSERVSVTYQQREDVQ